MDSIYPNSSLELSQKIALTIQNQSQILQMAKNAQKIALEISQSKSNAKNSGNIYIKFSERSDASISPFFAA